MQKYYKQYKSSTADPTVEKEAPFARHATSVSNFIDDLF
jgi:hypothetical protein